MSLRMCKPAMLVLSPLPLSLSCNQGEAVEPNDLDKAHQPSGVVGALHDLGQAACRLVLETHLKVDDSLSCERTTSHAKLQCDVGHRFWPMRRMRPVVMVY